MSVSYLKVICARSWGHIEAIGDLRSAINRLTATLFLNHNQKNHPVVKDILELLKMDLDWSSTIYNKF